MSSLSVLSNLPAVHSDGGLSRYLATIRKFPLLSAADEAMYARRWHEDGDRDAAYRLVTSHLRLAAKLALDPQAWEVSYGKAGAEGARS